VASALAIAEVVADLLHRARHATGIPHLLPLLRGPREQPYGRHHGEELVRGVKADRERAHPRIVVVPGPAQALDLLEYGAMNVHDLPEQCVRVTESGAALAAWRRWLVVEQTMEPTTWLIVTGWDATDAERRILSRTR
jgi:hypothetical protein